MQLPLDTVVAGWEQGVSGRGNETGKLHPSSALIKLSMSLKNSSAKPGDAKRCQSPESAGVQFRRCSEGERFRASLVTRSLPVGSLHFHPLPVPQERISSPAPAPSPTTKGFTCPQSSSLHQLPAQEHNNTALTESLSKADAVQASCSREDQKDAAGSRSGTWKCFGCLWELRIPFALPCPFPSTPHLYKKDVMGKIMLPWAFPPGRR